MEESEYGLKVTRLEHYKPRTNRIVTKQEIEKQEEVVLRDMFEKLCRCVY